MESEHEHVKSKLKLERGKMGESEAANSWKEMFLKALSSLKGLEKEIVHKDVEIQLLKSRIKVSEIDQVIRPPSESRENLMNEMKDLKSKLTATEVCLQQSLELNEKLEEERTVERQQQGVLNSAFEGLKAEVEAVLSATEAFKVEAFHSMQALTADVRRYQAVSDQKLQSLRHKVEKMEDLQSVHSGVLRTIAAEQEILRLICIARAAMQQSSAASLQHLTKMEQFCGKTIQKALLLIDSGTTKTLNTSHQVPERMVQLEGMAMKHRNELSIAEKNLLESLASQTNLGSLPDEENNDANFEFCMSHCTQDRQKTPIKRHSAAGIETKASAGTSIQQQAKRKLETSKQQTMREVVARRSPLPFPTHQERAEGAHS